MYTYRPDVDYPVTLAQWHYAQGVDTPVSGDRKWDDYRA